MSSSFLHRVRVAFLVVALVGLFASPLQSCGGLGAAPGPKNGGASGSLGSGGGTGAGGDVNTDAEDAAQSISEVGTPAASAEYVVAMVQSTQALATDISQAEVADMVTRAIAQAGGLDFIADGQTVVLKPNLVTPYANSMQSKPLDLQANGIATDWRVVKAVADLVRAKNPSGTIVVMEGSTVPAATAFSLLGYTRDNFGPSVDEFVGIEGASCTDTSPDNVVQRTANTGRVLWLNKRYASADVVISIPVMKTHSTAGITGGVKNLGIGTTPVGQYAAQVDGGTGKDCTRGQTPGFIDHTSAETLGQFIHDNYSVRPADFVVMDALQGIQHGPAPFWTGGNYATDKMNMRLVLAGRNAVAVDTVEALVMKCDPTQVPHLTKLQSSGLGTTDISKIAVVGAQISTVAKAFASSAATAAICPGL
jgi:uncharacterized protein (DUF362 family)